VLILTPRPDPVALARRGASYGLSFLSPLLAPSKRFVLLGPGRCGTELLVSLLQSHPDVVCDSEILADPSMLLPARYVEWRATQAGLRGAKAYGFKVLIQQVRPKRPHLDAPSYFRSIARRGDLIVLMGRRNLLQVATSYLSTEAVGGWHPRESAGGAQPRGRAVSIDPARLMSAVWSLWVEVEETRHQLRDVPHISIIYEDDLEDPTQHQATTDRVITALGLAPHAVKSDLVRVAGPRLPDRLANYDEVAAVFGRSRFAHYLDERPAPAQSTQ